ncbi:MAG: GNAT family N-acetyltransferase [Actinobacteria bacterium]|nr:GNAT family N-acetyltransferase [Actinomycetota bacterium]
MVRRDTRRGRFARRDGKARRRGDGERLRFRPLRRRDFALLGSWLAAPHVFEWWREPSEMEAIEARYGPCVDGADPTEVFVVEADAEPIGFVQRYRIDDDPDWRRSLAATSVDARGAAGIDYLIGVEDLTGRGVGPQMIRQFVDETFREQPDLSSIVVAVQQGNRRSWRALEKAGFARRWSGTLDSDDPSDDGPSHLYVRRRG